MAPEDFFRLVNLCSKSYPIFTCVDPDPYWEYGFVSGFSKLLNRDPIRIQIHNTAPLPVFLRSSRASDSICCTSSAFGFLPLPRGNEFLMATTTLCPPQARQLGDHPHRGEPGGDHRAPHQRGEGDQAHPGQQHGGHRSRRDHLQVHACPGPVDSPGLQYGHAGWGEEGHQNPHRLCQLSEGRKRTFRLADIKILILIHNFDLMSILFLTQKYFILKKLTCLQVATFGLSQLYFYCETAHEDLDFTVTFPTVKSPEAQIGEPSTWGTKYSMRESHFNSWNGNRTNQSDLDNPRCLADTSTYITMNLTLFYKLNFLIKRSSD